LWKFKTDAIKGRDFADIPIVDSILDDLRETEKAAIPEQEAHLKEVQDMREAAEKKLEALVAKRETRLDKHRTEKESHDNDLYARHRDALDAVNREAAERIRGLEAVRDALSAGKAAPANDENPSHVHHVNGRVMTLREEAKGLAASRKYADAAHALRLANELELAIVNEELRQESQKAQRAQKKIVEEQENEVELHRLFWERKERAICSKYDEKIGQKRLRIEQLDGWAVTIRRKIAKLQRDEQQREELEREERRHNAIRDDNV
jgi:hypothetical protein